MISPSLVTAASGLNSSTREAANTVRTSSPANSNSSNSKMTNFSIAAIMNSAKATTINGGQRRPSEETSNYKIKNGKIIYVLICIISVHSDDIFMDC